MLTSPNENIARYAALLELWEELAKLVRSLRLFTVDALIALAKTREDLNLVCKVFCAPIL